MSAIGARITREGLPLAAVLTIHAGAAQLGLLAALSIGPSVIVGLAAGGWVDRSRRRSILIGADLARAMALLSLPAAAWLHLLSMNQLYVVAALVGGLSVLFDIADHAYLPSLIAPADLMEGNAKLGVTESLGEIGGPALAGVLFQVLSPPVAIAVNAATYLASAVVLGTIRKAEPAAALVQTPPRWRDDLYAGLAAIFQDPRVRPLFLVSMTQSLFGSFFAALYILFALRTLGLTPAAMGVTIAMGGIGGLAGAALSPVLAHRAGVGPGIIIAGFGAGAATMLIPLATGRGVMAILMLAQFAGDALAVAAAIASTSLRQSVMAPGVLGRAGALFHAGPGAMTVIGALAGGALAGWLGMRETMIVAALGLTAAPLWALASPLRRLRTLPAETNATIST